MTEAISDRWTTESVKQGKLLDKAQFIKSNQSAKRDYSTFSPDPTRKQTFPSPIKKHKSSHHPPKVINHSYECQRRTPLHCLNEELVNQLRIITRYREALGDKRGAYSYNRAIAALKAYPKPLTSSNEAMSLSGVGPKIATLIEEWLKDNHISQVEICKNDIRVNKLRELMRVYGVGPKTAAKFLKKGIETISQLREAVKAGRVQLKHDQRIGLEYMEDLEQHLSRATLEEIAAQLAKASEEAQLPKCKVIIVGGYRRGKVENNYADILLSPIHQENSEGFITKLVKQLQDKGLIRDILQMVTSTTRATGHRTSSRHRKTAFNKLDQCLCIYRTKDGLHRRLDIVVAPKSRLPFALLGWTGSQQFERSIRLYAEREKNMNLSSESLVNSRTGEPIMANTEEEIFKILGLEYIEPEFRNC